MTPEEKKAYDAKRYQSNREAILTHSAKYYQEHRESKKARTAQYRQDHPDQRKAINAQYYQKNREKINAQHAKYRLEHPGESRVRVRAWSLANPLKRRENRAKREALEKGTATGLVDFAAIIERDKGICGLCGKRIRKGEKLHFDHIVPLSHGGPHVGHNIQVTHSRCNLQKGSRGKLPSQIRLPLGME